MKIELKDYIKERIENNCKKNVYKKAFSEETQNMILAKAEKIAKSTISETNLVAQIDFEIEETVRLMILKNKEK